MGLFGGLLNYEKPGPGVDKNEPKKKGFALYFTILVRKFWQLVPLSILTVLVSLPLVTIGLGDVGVTYVSRNFARQKPTLLKADFFDTIKKNWKQALPVGFLNLAITVLLLFDMYFFYTVWDSGLFYKIGSILSSILFFMFTFLKYYINMLMVTFNLKIKQLYRNSFLLSSAGLKANLIITAILAIVYAALFALPFVTMYLFEDMFCMLIAIFLAVLFLPAFRALTIQFWVFPVVKKHMIDPYYEQHPEDAKKDKYLLNILDDEEEGTGEDDQEEAVFRDLGTAETPAPKEEASFPKQYSKREIKAQRRRNQSDDDDTI